MHFQVAQRKVCEVQHAWAACHRAQQVESTNVEVTPHFTGQFEDLIRGPKLDLCLSSHRKAREGAWDKPLRCGRVQA